MTLSIRNPEADRLARQLAAFEEKPITDAVIIALKEALAARRKRETASEAADRILKKYGLTRSPFASRMTTREEIDAIHGDDITYEPPAP